MSGDGHAGNQSLGSAVEGTSRAIRITVSVPMPTPTSGTPLPTKLNRLFRLYTMRRNTPNATRGPSRFLDMEMSRHQVELVETARDRIISVADFPQLSRVILSDYGTTNALRKK